MTWEQTNLNPVSGRNSAACTYGEWHAKNNLLVHSGQRTYKKAESSWYTSFFPAFWSPAITRERQADKNRKTICSCGLNHEAGQQRWNRPVGMLLLLWGWRVPRRDGTEVWLRRMEGNSPQLFPNAHWTSTAFCEFRKQLLPMKFVQIPTIWYIFSTCIFTLSIMARISRFVQGSSAQNLLLVSDTDSRRARKDCAQPVFNHWGGPSLLRDFQKLLLTPCSKLHKCCQCLFVS